MPKGMERVLHLLMKLDKMEVTYTDRNDSFNQSLTTKRQGYYLDTITNNPMYAWLLTPLKTFACICVFFLWLSC